MNVFVSYTATVLAEVDLDSGQVVRVCVDDEAVGTATGAFSVECTVTALDRDAVTAIAERSAWPAWEFGS